MRKIARFVLRVTVDTVVLDLFHHVERYGAERLRHLRMSCNRGV